MVASQSVAPDLKIDRVSQDEGLPTLPVTYAIEDEDGFVWFSTWNGLYRFDGYTYTAFQHDPRDSTSISSDWVTSTVVDHDGRFWVATQGAGLNLMDRSSGRFTHFRHDPNDPSTLSSDDIAGMSLLSDGSLWIATSNGLNRFDPVTRRATSFESNPSDPTNLKGTSVRTVFEDAKGRIWVGTGNPFVPEGVGALNLLKPGGGFESFWIRPNDPSSLDNFIQSIVQVNDSTLLIAPWSGGIFRFEITKRRFSHFADPLRVDQSSPDPKIVNLTRQVGTSVLWVATYGSGLQRLDLESGVWAKYVFEAENPFTVPDNRVWGAWFDSSNRLWIGTHAGLSRTSVSGKFPRVSVNGLASNEWVTDILENTVGRLWIATSENVLIDWDPDADDAKRYPIPVEHCAGWNFPGIGLTRARAGNLWVVAPCGLFAFHPDEGRFEVLDVGITRSDIGSDQAIRILEDSDGMIWIPAQPALIRVDRSRHSHELFTNRPNDPASLSNNDVESIIQDRFGRIWVGTAAGLNKFDPSTANWKRYRIGEFDETSAVTSILDAGDGSLWLTTDRDGLVHFQPDTGQESSLGIRDGLHSNTVMLSVRDSDGLMWVISPTGLSVIDAETRAVRRFSTLDGLVAVRFGRHDMVTLSDGRMVIGGKGMLNILDPREYHPTSDPPNIVLTAIRARGRLIDPRPTRPFGSERVPIIKLRYNQNDLVFDYVGLRVEHPDQVRYSYQLSGIDDSWVDVGSERLARYTDLDPGDYVFKVRGATGSGPWSEVRSVSFSIQPPWWMTHWAYMFYFACLSGGIVLLVRMQAQRLVRGEHQRARAKELEQARELKLAYDELERTHTELKETQVRVDEIKSRFFANISHEFRTPLTLIIGQTEALLATADGKDRRKLEMLARNGRRLLRLINQLLDLSKLEAGGMELRPATLDLIPFFRNLVGSFESLAHQAGISLRFVSDRDALSGQFERDKLEKIFVNLVSNALKFTNVGEVLVFLQTESDGKTENVVVQVSDTGVGIPRERIPFIFDRFYQVGSTSRRPPEGTGIGLALVNELIVLHGGTIDVESEVDKGTVFTVRLPLTTGVNDEADVSTSDLDLEFDTVAAGRLQTVGSEPASANLVEEGLGGKEVILIVEDNLDVRTYIAENLTAEFIVAEAQNGEEGLDLALELTPDLVITDVMMPEMDGFDLARRLRSDQRTSHIPIIMLTARAGEDDKVEGLETGIDDYLIKPFSPRELNARVKNLIAQRRLLRERFGRATRITPSDVSAVSMDQEFVRQVLEAVEQNLSDEQYSVDALADDIGMSVSQLNRKLGALVDQSAGRLMRSMRLQRAADLLSRQAGTVGEIAYQVGFGSQANFATAFKRQFGVSPSEYSRTA